MDEPDIQRLIKELAATGVDPWWVYEAIAIEQEAAEAKRSEAVAAAASAERADFSRQKTRS